MPIAVTVRLQASEQSQISGGGSGLRSSPRPRSSPGDLVYFDGAGHVAMYVGGGYTSTPRRPEWTCRRSRWVAGTLHPGRSRPPV